MKKYSVPNLTAKTSSNDQVKLVTALKGVAGVENATLRPATSQFEITARGNKEPKIADISAAASKAGFPVSDKK